MSAIVWLRNDLRLRDNLALQAALKSGEPVIPVYILDDSSAGIWKAGGATRWWLHHSLQALDAQLRAKGMHPLVFLKGDAYVQINTLMKETKAAGIYWNRRYEPWAMEVDARIKENLEGKAHSFDGFLMFEPWKLKNKSGGQYKVFTPFSKACFALENEIRKPLNYKTAAFDGKPIKRLSLDDLALMPKINWYGGMADEWQPGEEGAHKRLKQVISRIAGHYKEQRDYPATDGVSRLSPYLHFGELSPHQVWHAVQVAIAAQPRDKKFADNALGFLRQLIWREFSWYLLYHDHNFPEKPWNRNFTHFPWKKDAKLLRAWQKGQTGYPIVDAGMRQLWQTGWMHNRVRMIVGSFLVKHLLINWRSGEDWFWDTLVDADLGNNAAGWQWIAGSGADAAPYFRIFNPILQSRKFDPKGDYIRAYVPELAGFPDEFLHAPWEAPPLILNQLKGKYPPPVVDHSKARATALEAYQQMKHRAGDESRDEEYGD